MGSRSIDHGSVKLDLNFDCSHSKGGIPDLLRSIRGVSIAGADTGSISRIKDLFPEVHVY